MMRGIEALAAAVLAVVSASAAPAQDVPGRHGRGVHASSIRIPLTATGGIAVADAGPKCKGSDTVSLSADSEVHVVAIPKRDEIRVNAADISGTGALGNYVAVGSHWADTAGDVPSDGSLKATTTFRLIGTDHKCKSGKLPVSFQLMFANGILQSSSTACVTDTLNCPPPSR